MAISDAEMERIDAELRATGTRLDMDEMGQAIFKFIGFSDAEVGRTVGRGRFVVDERSCQPFGVLQGGTTGHIAESLASAAAAYGAQGQRVAGVNMTVNHLRPAAIGQELTAVARALIQGRNIQVWDVVLQGRPPRRSKSDSGDSGGSSRPEPALFAVARVTLLVMRAESASGAAGGGANPSSKL